MKYCPMELVEYVMQEGKQGDLLTAVMNNDADYGVLPVNGKVEKTDNWYQYVFDNIGIDLEPFEMTNTSEETAIKMMENPQNVSACVVLHNEVAQVIIDYCEGTDEEKELNLWSLVFADMFEQLKIDTKGKLKKFIENGLVKQYMYNSNDKKLMSLLSGKI